MLDGIANVLQALTDYYTSLLNNGSFSLSVRCRPDVESFVAQTKDSISDCRMQRDRAVLLTRIAAERKTLVSHATESHI